MGPLGNIQLTSADEQQESCCLAGSSRSSSSTLTACQEPASDVEDEQPRPKLDKGKGKEVIDEDAKDIIIPWAKDAGRPPQKLPIRFIDFAGRSFLWPWERARTWTVSTNVKIKQDNS